MGTRLRPLTYVLPKPLFPIDDKVLVHKLLEHLDLQGLTDVTLSLGYKGAFVRNYCESEGLKVRYVSEDAPLGTAGPCRLIKDEVKANILLLNGDILTTMNFRKMEQFHKDNGCGITVAYKEHEKRTPFGEIVLDGQNNIVDIVEKPTAKANIFIGISIVRKDVLGLIGENESIDMPALIKRVVKENLTVKGYGLLPGEKWNALEHMFQFDGKNISKIEEA